jgi:XapX domain-containing protein
MKIVIGLILAVFVGIGCRFFSIPLPGPPAILGAFMAVAMATGYTLTDHLLPSKSPSIAASPQTSTTQEKQNASAN